ncbi:MAG: hypothetical protein EOO89_04880 [Pedobacter sp.]|nr:MAG: hypothetical protein EOO89_04880 [Pedobacter sp.]
MARDIKAIQCPKCGSTFKQEVKTDFYRCQNCGTEYFLDSDDTHIYHHHERVMPTQSSAPPVNAKLPVFVLIAAILLIVVAYVVTKSFKPQTNAYNANVTYKIPRSYFSTFVYTNMATKNPVYLRMGVDYINKGNSKSEQELHAQFNNVMDGKLLADRIISDEGMRNNRCALTFKIYSPEVI